MKYSEIDAGLFLMMQKEKFINTFIEFFLFDSGVIQKLIVFWEIDRDNLNLIATQLNGKLLFV